MILYQIKRVKLTKDLKSLMPNVRNSQFPKIHEVDEDEDDQGEDEQ